MIGFLTSSKKNYQMAQETTIKDIPKLVRIYKFVTKFTNKLKFKRTHNMKREYDARACNENDFGAKRRLSHALIYHVTHL